MWIFTKHGYLATVQHRDEPDTIIVRTRVKKDLVTCKKLYFKKMGKIEFNETADYPYRANISKADFAEGMALAIQDTDYEKFKSAVGDEQGRARESLYTNIWSTLTRLDVPKRFQKYLDRQNREFEADMNSERHNGG